MPTNSFRKRIFRISIPLLLQSRGDFLFHYSRDKVEAEGQELVPKGNGLVGCYKCKEKSQYKMTKLREICDRHVLDSLRFVIVFPSLTRLEI